MRVCQFRHFGTLDYRRISSSSPNIHFTGCRLAVKPSGYCTLTVTDDLYTFPRVSHA